MANSAMTTGEGLAEQLVLSSFMPALLLDGDTRVVIASRSFARTFETNGNPEHRLLAELGLGEWSVPQLHSLIEVALGDGPIIDTYEMDLKRPDTAVRRLRVNARKVASGSVAEARVLLTIEDTTDARLAAEAERRLVRERDALLRERSQAAEDRSLFISEMRHRIANSLQIIASILMLKARAVKSDEGRMHLEDACDRVLTIAGIQRQLCEGLDDIAVGPYLTSLAGSLSASMIRGHRPVTLTVEADESVVHSNVAVSMGLIVTELVINALKHAFPDSRAGSIVVRYRSDPPKWALSVEDDGIGMPKDRAKAHVGLGTSLISALARQMKAVVAVADCNPGTKTTLTGSADPIVPTPAAA
ncbi:sensor histidine kinase [Methyloraptor flagellatus]|uniref:histidine kinase n=1 Tax=Methyloraptor flagellatus TaxID=3162530 RepID=A0AAU7X823_9HYPH